MADFEYEKIEGLNGRAFIWVDDGYDVAVIRTDEGLVVDAYPKVWDSPLERVTVRDEDAVVEQEEKWPGWADSEPPSIRQAAGGKGDPGAGG